MVVPAGSRGVPCIGNVIAVRPLGRVEEGTVTEPWTVHHGESLVVPVELQSDGLRKLRGFPLLSFPFGQPAVVGEEELGQLRSLDQVGDPGGQPGVVLSPVLEQAAHYFRVAVGARLCERGHEELLEALLSGALTEEQNLKSP